MDLANPRPLMMIAGAIFVSVVGWKLVQNNQKKMQKIQKSIEAPPKNVNSVAIRSDKKACFLELLRLGEQSLAAGNYEEAANYLADATLYCDNKESLNEIFVASLPAPIYTMFQNALKLRTQSERKAILENTEENSTNMVLSTSPVHNN